VLRKHYQFPKKVRICTCWLLLADLFLYCDFINFVLASQACCVHSLPSGTSCTVSRYFQYLHRLTIFLLLRYTAVVSPRRYRRYLQLVSTISIVVSWVSHNTNADRRMLRCHGNENLRISTQKWLLTRLVYEICPPIILILLVSYGYYNEISGFSSNIKFSIARFV